MDLGNLLKGAGLFLCLGGVLLVVLVAFLARSVFASRRPQRMDTENSRVWREEGRERPRYDSDRIESSGGFGRAPTRSERRESPGRDLDDRLADTGGGQNINSYPANTRRERSDDDGDDAFRGGFGG
jgi:hypothetical protein